jgi:hypothetical protein
MKDKQRIKALEEAVKYVLKCAYNAGKSNQQVQDALDNSGIPEPTGDVLTVLVEIGTKVKNER